METQTVFVIDSEGQPLLPTHPARARQLLRKGKAQVYQMMPFTIQLLWRVENPVGGLTIGIDDGSKTVGLAVVNETTNQLVFVGNIKLRQDVKRKMQQRAMYRRTRRSRKLRHRKARFDRKKGKGWLSPTIRQKKESIVRVVRDLQTIMPIEKVVVEQGMFDVAALASEPEVIGTAYQIPDYQGHNFREKVLWRDSYQCQHCGSSKYLQAHHIQPRANGGTNTPQNGITLCQTCHKALHQGEWALDKKPKQFRYPAHLQMGKQYLQDALADLGLQVEVCFGWMTHFWRKALHLAKSHIHDALAMVCRNEIPHLCCSPYLIIPKRKKVWENNPTKTNTERHGFRHWDVVQAKHRTHGIVVGSIRSLKANALTLRTTWDANFPVAYGQSRLIWRFNNIVYIEDSTTQMYTFS